MARERIHMIQLLFLVHPGNNETFNVGLALIQRRRRWTSAKTTLIKCTRRARHVQGGGPGATVVKAICLGSRWSRVRTPFWPSGFKETKLLFSSPLTREYSVLWGASVTER